MTTNRVIFYLLIAAIEDQIDVCDANPHDYDCFVRNAEVVKKVIPLTEYFGELDEPYNKEMARRLKRLVNREHSWDETWYEAQLRYHLAMNNEMPKYCDYYYDRPDGFDRRFRRLHPDIEPPKIAWRE